MRGKIREIREFPKRRIHCIRPMKELCSALMGTVRHGHGLMHAAESGEYGEALVRLELSRAGWPLVLPCRGVAIDILAVAPSQRRIGISVKCRDRGVRNPNESTYIFREKQGKRSANDEIARFREICGLLAAEPWIAVVTITPKFCYSHLTSLENYEKSTQASRATRLGITRQSG